QSNNIIHSFFNRNMILKIKPKIKSLLKNSDKIMKIAAISGIVLLTSCGHALAQRYNEEYNTFVGGLIGGANFTQVDGDGYRGYDKTGWNVGGIVYLPFGDVDLPVEGTVALSMEVLYSQKGAIGDGPVPHLGILNQTIHLHYAE